MTARRVDLGRIARQAMIDRGLEPDFPAAALRQADALGGPATDASARDLRGLAWASIDNDDSRDLDQLTVAEALPGRGVRVLVAIAEVDALVGRNSPIDAHASRNTTSVYTATRIFPMLPEKLSTDLTSLAEHQERLAVVIDFVVADDGSIASSDIYRARYLQDKGFPTFRRVVRSPERWEKIREVAAGFGDTLPLSPDAAALSAFLVRRRAADALRFPDLSLSIVKLLGRGEYVVQRPGEPGTGHFGLAVSDYVHSTAPNRRLPDLVTQRLLKAALGSAPVPYADDELAALATHCTEQEDAAKKVERQVRKSCAALLLSSRIGERFDGIVTGVSNKGTWVRVLHPPVDGKVVRGAAGLDVGDRVAVRLVGVNVERGFIDFERAA